MKFSTATIAAGLVALASAQITVNLFSDYQCGGSVGSFDGNNACQNFAIPVLGYNTNPTTSSPCGLYAFYGTDCVDSNLIITYGTISGCGAIVNDNGTGVQTYSLKVADC